VVLDARVRNARLRAGQTKPLIASLLRSPGPEWGYDLSLALWEGHLAAWKLHDPGVPPCLVWLACLQVLENQEAGERFSRSPARLEPAPNRCSESWEWSLGMRLPKRTPAEMVASTSRRRSESWEWSLGMRLPRMTPQVRNSRDAALDSPLPRACCRLQEPLSHTSAQNTECRDGIEAPPECDRRPATEP
jgi:hypothetical protein